VSSHSTREQRLDQRSPVRTLAPHLARFYPYLKWGILGVAGVVLIGGILEPLIATVAQGETWRWNPAIVRFLKAWGLLIGFGSVVLMGVWYASWWASRYEKGRKDFHMAKPAHALASPNEIASAKMFAEYANEESDAQSARPWKNRYVELPLVPYDDVKREGFDTPETVSDKQFAGLLGENYDVLLIGIPTSGKTRKVFEVLRTHLPNREVIVPHRGDNLTSNLSHEAKWYLRNKEVIVVLDDLNLHASKGDALKDSLEKIREAAKRCAVVGTCRDGAELSTARDRELDGRLIQGSTINNVYQGFRAHRYFVRPPDAEQSRRIARCRAKTI